ncbi:uncharacterized protein LACBIDRAFT_328540 [Laccaria bicolor S238N-H82]|uniref:Predicted protein n=1 Tax=Laccaria bicolor (strain S238N-H82 / ATCC MYA-4686) TaxID=486041 RepID=B0DF77_LACBS|nr:uncharacterized protein LACBIDRAFT_328540 [Laccaria bicolor S238N-H82]EDR06664.1 predicted protein [Laccaria bicolor S238N-H82]|eukprot:XP_001882511.1 predicted protein [Laccaria bicolor S238N-H82]
MPHPKQVVCCALCCLALFVVFSDVQGFVNPPRVRGKGQEGKGQGSGVFQGFFRGFISLISSLSNYLLQTLVQTLLGFLTLQPLRYPYPYASKPLTPAKGQGFWRISVIGSYSFDTSQIPMTHETFPHQMIRKCFLLVEWYIAVLASPNTMKVLCQYPFDFHDLELVQIVPHSVKTLPKTVYETDLNLLRFLWSRARSDSPTLCEDAPQNHLRNGQGLVELGPQSAPFSVVKGSFT